MLPAHTIQLTTPSVDHHPTYTDKARLTLPTSITIAVVPGFHCYRPCPCWTYFHIFTPKVLLEQLIGRIMRMAPNKLEPEVIDINFAGYADRKQNNLRLGFYLEKGWEIETI